MKWEMELSALSLVFIVTFANAWFFFLIVINQVCFICWVLLYYVEEIVLISIVFLLFRERNFLI
jgi:hypothetical protein